MLLSSSGERGLFSVERVGDYGRFTASIFRGLSRGMGKFARRQLLMQMFEVGTLSIPVVMITGAFIGAVLAIEAFPQFESIGLASHIGSVINISVVKQIGPVLTAVMLAGRVGGSLTAELGTMKVTEQIGCDAGDGLESGASAGGAALRGVSADGADSDCFFGCTGHGGGVVHGGACFGRGFGGILAERESIDGFFHDLHGIPEGLFLWRGYRIDCVLQGISLRGGGAGRRPRLHGGVRRFLRHNPRHEFFHRGTDELALPVLWPGTGSLLG